MTGRTATASGAPTSTPRVREAGFAKFANLGTWAREGKLSPFHATDGLTLSKVYSVFDQTAFPRLLAIACALPWLSGEPSLTFQRLVRSRHSTYIASITRLFQLNTLACLDRKK